MDNQSQDPNEPQIEETASSAELPPQGENISEAAVPNSTPPADPVSQESPEQPLPEQSTPEVPATEQAPYPEQSTSTPDVPEVKKSSTVPVMVGFVVVVGLLLGGILIYKNASDKTAYQNATYSKTKADKSASAVQTSQPTTDSDASIDTASTQIDTNVTSLGADMSEIDQSLNDHPEDLSQ